MNCIAFPEGKALVLTFDGVLYLLDSGRMTRLYEGVHDIQWYKGPFIRVINKNGQIFLLDRSLARFDYAQLSTLVKFELVPSFSDAFSLTTTVSAFYVFNRYKRLICSFLAFSGKYNPLITSVLQSD